VCELTGRFHCRAWVVEVDVGHVGVDVEQLLDDDFVLDLCTDTGDFETPGLYKSLVL
jgi:hypothetical protein